MATIEVTVTWCDQHLLEGQEVAGTPRALSVDGLMGTVDLCDPCMKELASKLLFLLEAGRPAEEQVAPLGAAEPTAPIEAVAAKRARLGPRYSGPRKWVCLLCQEEYAGTAGLRGHLGTVHGLTDTTIGSVYGDVCPVDGEDMGHGKQSATGHARGVHRANNVSKLFERAIKKGDPYGVVAARVADLLQAGAYAPDDVQSRVEALQG